MEPTIDDLKEGDAIEWEEANGETREGTVTEVHEDDWEVYVDFFKGNFVAHTEVRLTQITKINGVTI